MIRVAILSTDLDRTAGWGNVTDELCNAFLKRDDVDFELHLPKHFVGDAEVGRVAFAEKVRFTLPTWTGTFSRRPLRALPVWLASPPLGNVDIIHTLIEFPYAMVARRMAARAHVPYVVMTQGTYAVTPMRHWIDRWRWVSAIEQADHVTAPSRYTEDAIHNVSGIRHDVDVISNAVNYDRFQRVMDPGSISAQADIPDDAHVLLTVGADKARKGFDVALRAFAIVAQQDPEAHLVIVGQGSPGEREAMAAELGVADRVHLPGRISDDELVAWYQRCDLYLHLARNYKWNFDGHSMVCLEAAACGKPVVASRSGGIPDAVAEGETAFLIEEEDHEAAAAAALRILQDPPLAKAMGEAGKVFAGDRSWDWYAGELVKLYQQTLA